MRGWWWGRGKSSLNLGSVDFLRGGRRRERATQARRVKGGAIVSTRQIRIFADISGGGVGSFSIITRGRVNVSDELHDCAHALASFCRICSAGREVSGDLRGCDNGRANAVLSFRLAGMRIVM